MVEELFVLAARIRIHLVIQHLHQYLMTPSHPQLHKTTQAPHLHAVAQRLLEVSAHVMMNDRERAFIHKCLQDCLWYPPNESTLWQWQGTATEEEWNFSKVNFKFTFFLNSVYNSSCINMLHVVLGPSIEDIALNGI